MGFEPTTLRDLVGCSNHLSYWRLYGEQGPICGSRLEPHHAATQPSNDRKSNDSQVMIGNSEKEKIWFVHHYERLVKWLKTSNCKVVAREAGGIVVPEVTFLVAE